MVPGRLEWDVELFEEIFVARDVAKIQSIPLSQSFVAYQYVWHFTNSGEYMVKTGYHVLTQLLGVHSQLSQEGEWSNIWALKTPPLRSKISCGECAEGFSLPSCNSNQKVSMSLPLAFFVIIASRMLGIDLFLALFIHPVGRN